MLLFVVFVVFWSLYFHIILFDNEKTHHYAGFVWGFFFITVRNSDTVSVYDHPFLPPWEGWFAQTLITRLGHPQMGKKQMVPTFSGKNNSIFDGRKPYLTAWDLEKCNEWDNKSSIKCNNNKSNVLYQERKTPCGSTGLGTTSWGRSWGLRWVNSLFHWKKMSFWAESSWLGKLIFTFSWHYWGYSWGTHLKGMNRGRAELRDTRMLQGLSTSSAKSGVGSCTGFIW